MGKFTYPDISIISIIHISKRRRNPRRYTTNWDAYRRYRKIDEGEVTLYILGKDDYTLCPKGYQTVIAIGPTFKEWINPIGDYHTEAYFKQKQEEKNRILDLIEKRFPGFKDALCHVELSTPATLQRLVMKEKGAVAGPKQQLGQHMLKRLKTKGEIEGLYNCGESTVMGTGTPAVTVSGISVANLIWESAICKNMKRNTSKAIM